jgi:hypothetical protein
MEKIRIRDKNPGTATLKDRYPVKNLVTPSDLEKEKRHGNGQSFEKGMDPD